MWVVYNPAKDAVAHGFGKTSRYPRHSVNFDQLNPVNYDLSISGTKMADAGRYECIETTSLTSEGAELVVLGW